MLPTNPSIQESFDDVFNYASFMWDGNDIWQPQNWGHHQDLPMLDATVPNPMMVSHRPQGAATSMLLDYTWVESKKH